MRKLWAHEPNSAICVRQTSFALVNLSPRELSQPAPEERDTLMVTTATVTFPYSVCSVEHNWPPTLREYQVLRAPGPDFLGGGGS